MSRNDHGQHNLSLQWLPENEKLKNVSMYTTTWHESKSKNLSVMQKKEIENDEWKR